jgi:hypothetical protein
MLLLLGLRNLHLRLRVGPSDVPCATPSLSVAAVETPRQAVD